MLAWAVLPAFFRVRVLGRQHLPGDCGILVVCNHQSYADPVLLGLALRRKVSFMARQSLFRMAPFRWLIRSLNAFAVRPGEPDLAAAREAVARLRAGEVVCLFPEGTRTRDGGIGHFRPGFVMIAARAGVPIVPAAIEGAFAAWPRHCRFPMPGWVWVAFGKPVAVADGDVSAGPRRAELGERIRGEVERLQHCLRQRRALGRRF